MEAACPHAAFPHISSFSQIPPPKGEVTGLADHANMEPFNTPKGYICPLVLEACGRRFGRPTVEEMQLSG